MKKLTDVLKYNKEIEKKNQGAVINYNNPVKGNSINLQKLTGTAYVPETERKQTTTLEAIAYNRQKEREAQYQKDNNEVIYNGFKSSFIDEDAYNWRRSTRDSSIPAYGSKNFFINRKNELATQIQRETAQLPQLTGVEESGYNLYKTNPDVLRYGTDEQKIAYNYYSTLDRKRNRLNALSAEYNAVLGILNANETKGVHLNKKGEVDTRSGISEAQREKNEYGVVQNFYKKDYSFSPISILSEARVGDEQARYDRNMKTEGKIVLADDKIKAYKYYDENKDNEYDDGLFGRIGANFKSGTIGEKIADTGANSWEYATDDIEAAEVYQQLDKRLRENNKEAYTDNNAFDTFVSTLSNYAPQFINQSKAQAVGQLAGATLGVFMGNPLTGARIGGAAASSADMFRRTVGSQYVELLQNSDMSEEDIKALATNTALVEATLEFGISYIADKLIFGGKTVSKKIGAEKLEDGIMAILRKGKMSEKGAQIAVNSMKFLGKQAIEGVGEGAEEFLQTGTEIVAGKHAERGETVSAIELLKETFDFASYTKEDFAQMKSSALAGFIISAGSTGTVKSAIASYRDAVDTVNTSELGKTVKQAKLFDEYIADAVTYCKNSTNTEIVDFANRIEQKMENGKVLTDEEAGMIIKHSVVSENHNPFEITGGYVEKGLKLEQSKSGLVTVYSKDWVLSPDSAPVKVIEGLAKLSNSKIVIEDLDAVEVTDEMGNKKLVDNMGFVQDGVIHINSANAKTRLGAMVALHEVTHNIENSDLYSAYKKIAFDIMYGGENTDSYKEAYNTIAERYGDKVSGKEDIDKELVANFTMKRLDEKVINRIVMQNRNVAVRMFNALKAAYNKVKSAITGTEQDLSDIERALDIFDRALKERRKTIDNSNATPFVDEEGNVRFSKEGSGEKRYLLNENFVNDYDNWVANGRPDRQSLNIGTTSSALQSIGVKDQKITWDTNKINTSLKKHSYLTDDILKQVPEILEKPIIVMQSKGFDSRITMFGEVYDSDGLPIMAVLELLPLKDKSGVVLDEIKVVSTHSRKNNNPNSVVQTQSIIDTSDILYVEPNIKRTNNWLTRTRLQLPFGVTNYGSIKRITYPNGNVNTNNMQKGQNDAQGSNGKQHLLGGETSVVANNKTLAEARRMNLKGEPQSEIFKKTGWYKGIDKRWRYEIPDDNARFVRKGDLVFKKDHPDYARYRELLDIQNRYILEMEGGRELTEAEKKEYEKLKNIWSNTFTQNGKVTPDAGTQDRLEAYFDHPELYEAYPQLKDLRIVFKKDISEYGSYDRKNKTITIRDGMDNSFTLYTLLHEVQHAVQDIEGFARGSSVAYWENKLREEGKIGKYERRILELRQQRKEAYEGMDDRFRILVSNYYNSQRNGNLKPETIDRLYDELAEDKDYGLLFMEYDNSLFEESILLDDNTPMTAQGLYEKTAGEIEAREVVHRKGMDKEYLKKTVPYIGGDDTVFADDNYSAYKGKDNKGNDIWIVETGKDIFKGLNTPEEYRDAAYSYLIANRDNKVTVKDNNGKEIVFIRLSAEEFTHSEESAELLKNNPEMFNQKMRLVPSLQDLLMNANANWQSPDHKNHKLFKQNGFENYRGKVRIDNVIFNSVVRVGKAKFGNVFYDINLEVDSYLPHTENSASDINESTSIDNIPQSMETVNDYSMQEDKKYLLGAVISEENETTAPEYQSTAKSRTRLERYENDAVRKVADAMSVRLGTAREFLKPIIQEMSTEYMKTGKLSQETIDRLFEEAYKNGKIVNDEAYKGYADLRNYLRNTKIYFDSESAADIPDFFKDIRRYMGRLSVSSTSGTSVDSIYQELNEMHPSLFPDDILSSSDRMLKIMEVSDSLRKEEITLDAYYNTDEAKGHLKHEFEKAVYEFKDHLYEVKHFNDSLADEKPTVEIERNEKEQVAYLRNAYSELSSARKNAEKIMGKLLITEEEKEIAEKVISGAIRSEKIKSLGLNTDAINKYIEAYGTVRTLEKEIKKENTKVRAERIGRITKLLENSDNWKDKKVFGGIRYATETQERNIEDITTNPEEADAIKEAIFEPIDIHEAESNRYKNKLLDDIDKLEISQKVAKGNKHSEAYAVQFLGETQGEIEYLEEKLAKYDNGEIVDIQEDTKAQGIFDKTIGTRKNIATKEEIESYVDYAYRYSHETNVKHNNLFPKQKAQIIIGKVNKRLINDLKKEYGIDVSNVFHALNDNDIRHIKNSHGELTKEKYPITAEDQKQIPDIIENYDDVLYLKRPDGKEGIYYVKRHNGVTYYLESISDKGKILSNKQMIKVSTGTIPDIPGLKDAINKKWNIDSALNDSKVPQMYVQDVWNNDVHTDNVSQKAENVNSKKSWIEKDREKLAQLKRDADVFIDANPKLDYGKIDKCIGEFRKIYNELFEMMNEARIRNGYAPVEYRKNYFPHFVENKGDSFLNELGRAFGFDLENKFFMSDTVTSLPTEIMGRTADRKPGIKWLANALHRSKDSITDYDAIDGFAKYVTGVCDVIFHTDDIQNVRAFSNAIRYKYSDDGVKEKIAEIGENDTLTDEDKLKQISEKLQEGYKNKLGNYAVNLDKYANVLAGKQVGFLDRVVEDNLGRRTLRNWSRFQGKIGANMIVGNAKTPFMNFATIPQARKELSYVDLAYGIFHTLKNIKTPDGFDDKSTFLTNRVKVGNPDRVKTMSKPKHFLDAIGKPLEFTDALTSGLIWRARYHQNIVKRNMPSEEAIREADAYTKKLIGGRSYGSMPTLFYSKSGKVITQYMLETNNLISNITKDLSRYAKKDSKGVAEAIVRASWRFIKYSLAAELLADLFEKWFGNDGIQSPLGIVLDGIDDFTKLRVPNAFDAIEMLIEEGAIELEDEAEDPAVAIGNSVVNVLEDLPFTSIITDGRIPASAGMFDVTELVKIFSDPKKVSNKKKMDIILNEFVVPLSYRTLPAGAGQLKKTVEGINAYNKGGSYKINNKGEEELQYPIDKNIGNAIKTTVWGKSSTKGSRGWVEEGFGSLTSEQTELYQRIIEDKKTSRTDVYNAINAASKAKSVKDGDKSKTSTQVRHETLESTKGLTPSQKAEVEISFYSKGEDGKKGKREKAQDLIDFGIAPEKVAKLYYDYDVHDDVSKETKYEKFFAMTDGRTKKVYEKWEYEPELSVIKREALANDNSLSPEEKQEVNIALFGETKTQYDFSSVDGYYYSSLTENQQAGYDAYIQNYGENSMNARTFYYVTKVMNSQKDGKGSKKVDKISRLRKIGVPLNRANRIYNLLN